MEKRPATAAFAKYGRDLNVQSFADRLYEVDDLIEQLRKQVHELELILAAMELGGGVDVIAL